MHGSNYRPGLKEAKFRQTLFLYLVRLCARFLVPGYQIRNFQERLSEDIPNSLGSVLKIHVDPRPL